MRYRINHPKADELSVIEGKLSFSDERTYEIAFIKKGVCVRGN